MELDFEDIVALRRISEAIQRQNALKRVELHTELEARADYPSNPKMVEETIAEMERTYLRDSETGHDRDPAAGLVRTGPEARPGDSR
jgi:hypothetical protein